MTEIVHHKTKQLNLNTLLITGLFATVGYFGHRIIDKVDDTAISVVRLEGRVGALEGSVREGVTRSELAASLSQRDAEIQELKKSLSDLRRATRPHPLDVKP